MIRLILLVPGCVLAIYAGFFLIDALWPREARADIGVVLGNQVLANGQPSARLAARLDAGVRAYKSGLVPLILVSGGVGPSGYDEATVMRGHLIRLGVPAAAIMVDSDGVNTTATARNAASLMRRMGLRRALVITQYYHVPRSLLAFHKAGIEFVGATYPTFVEVRDIYSIARELVALPAYFLSR